MIEKLNPIGIGTYKLDLENKKETLDGLLYSFRKGQNYISTSLMYSDCAIVDFLKDFFNKINREEIFVMSHLEKYIEKKSDVEKQVDEYLKRMGIEYIDALQIHTPEVCKLPLLDVYYEMKKVQEKGKVRYLSTIGLSNIKLLFTIWLESSTTSKKIVSSCCSGMDCSSVSTSPNCDKGR